MTLFIPEVNRQSDATCRNRTRDLPFAGSIPVHDIEFWFVLHKWVFYSKNRNEKIKDKPKRVTGHSCHMRVTTIVVFRIPVRFTISSGQIEKLSISL